MLCTSREKFPLPRELASTWPGVIAAAWPPAGAGVEKRTASIAVSAATVSVAPGGR
jgi:hypothetical protein